MSMLPRVAPQIRSLAPLDLPASEQPVRHCRLRLLGQHRHWTNVAACSLCTGLAATLSMVRVTACRKRGWVSRCRHGTRNVASRRLSCGGVIDSRVALRGNGVESTSAVSVHVVPSEIVPLFTDEWQQEASKCWSTTEGMASGQIADMMSYDLEWDDFGRPGRPATMLYSLVKEKQPHTPRPWKRLENGGTVEPLSNPYDQDFDMVMRVFKAGGSDAQRRGTLLDVGCGGSPLFRHFARSGMFERVITTDVSWDKLELAQAEAEAEGLKPEDGVFLIRLNVQELPFREGQIDYVWWGSGIHLVADPEAALKNLFAATKPGGRLLGTTYAVSFGVHQLQHLAAAAGFVRIEVSEPRTGIYLFMAERP